MNHWLVKSEPVKWSWAQMQDQGLTHWDGVRNPQAQGYMKQMKKGDLAYFYHSNEGKEIVGIVEIAREAYPDDSDETGRSIMVDVAFKKSLKNPVTLAQIKANPALDGIALVRQSRLSVMPIAPAHWKIIAEMAQ